MRSHMRRDLLAIVFVSIAVCAAERAPAGIAREDVTFSITHTPAAGQALYVMGNIPELGNNSAPYAVRLAPGADSLWFAAVAIPKGTAFTYLFISRTDDVALWFSGTNQTPIGSVLSGATTASQPCPTRKGLLYHSAWSRVTLYWRPTGGSYTAVPMQGVGAGRTVGEQRWRALGVGQAQRRIEFYFTSGSGGRDPISGYYATYLDAFFVQDGHIFDYVPPATVSAPQQINTFTFFSTTLGENRPYRVLLPRGYVENSNKRYPVLYMHDGQNVFDMGTFGTWNADETAAAMMKQGTMQEIIIVGVDNTASRAKDYIPPDDTVPFGPGAGGPGQAHAYAAFLISELKPVIDGTYRTCPDRQHTATLGSSLGGLVSMYLGWDFNHVFSKCGPMSGSWQFANFLTRMASEPARDLRVYLDSGDSGASNDNAYLAMLLRQRMLQKGVVLERDLRYNIGYGHQHNEAAWAARLPKAYEFLFPATEGEQPLMGMLFVGDQNGDAAIGFVDFELLAGGFGGGGGGLGGAGGGGSCGALWRPGSGWGWGCGRG